MYSSLLPVAALTHKSIALILHAMHCYHNNSKQHVLWKLRLDDKKSHQRSISNNVLLTLANILMNNI